MRRRFRPSAGTYAFVLLSAIVVTAPAVISVRVHAPMGLRIALFAFGLFAVIAVIDLVLTHVTLTADSLEFFTNLRRRSVPRAEIRSVTWAKGGGVSIRIVGDRWIHLPEVGPSSQGLVNSIRAWLRRTETDHEGTAGETVRPT